MEGGPCSVAWLVWPGLPWFPMQCGLASVAWSALVSHAVWPGFFGCPCSGFLPAPAGRAKQIDVDLKDGQGSLTKPSLTSLLTSISGLGRRGHGT